MNPPPLLQRATRRQLPFCWKSTVQRPTRHGRRFKNSNSRQTRTGEETETPWLKHVQEAQTWRGHDVLSFLEERGFIGSITGDRDTLRKLFVTRRIGAYVGVDPTAPSLHIGHLLPFMALSWLYIHGHRTVSLVGGATAGVGDPTGRTLTREVQNPSVRQTHTNKMLHQLRFLWASVERSAERHGHTRAVSGWCNILNNNEWLAKLGIMDFLQVMGPGARLGAMLSRDTVKNKMERGDGMSFAEFTYPLLQSWDWWHLYQYEAIQVQIGGSDQFGNIVAGIDAVNYILKNQPESKTTTERLLPKALPIGFTVPLLTTPSGEKLGKSAGNAIWLDPSMTSSFDLYQYFLRLADADVERYLKLFTFIPTSLITEIVDRHMQNPSKRTAQHALAREVVELVHGRKSAEETEEQHRILFRKKGTSTDVGETVLGTEAPLSEQPGQISGRASLVSSLLPRSLVFNEPVARVFRAAGLVKSHSAGYRLVANGGAYVGLEPITSSRNGHDDGLVYAAAKYGDLAHKFMNGDLLFLRVGKTRIKVCKVVSDYEFEKRGLDCPGWKEVKQAAEKSAKKIEMGQT